jgi:adenosylcobinamide kinase/adenosylcobinamide-phosphate guanylyltransferase
VGMGVTPMGALSRQFVDECGWLHQDLAQMADKVTLVMFGLPQILKLPPTL